MRKKRMYTRLALCLAVVCAVSAASAYADDEFVETSEAVQIEEQCSPVETEPVPVVSSVSESESGAWDSAPSEPVVETYTEPVVTPVSQTEESVSQVVESSSPVEEPASQAEELDSQEAELNTSEENASIQNEDLSESGGELFSEDAEESSGSVEESSTEETTESDITSGDDSLTDYGEDTSEETYMTPAGGATLTINDIVYADSYANDTVGSALQNALNGAAAKIQTMSQKPETFDIVVTLSEGTYEGGLELNVNGGETSTGYILRNAITNLLGKYNTSLATITIAAEDSGDADTGFTSSGEGIAELEGGAVIDGFNLLMAGIYFSMNSTVSVSNADSFTYYGTSMNDCVTIETDCVDTVNIDTGGGDDNVELAVKQTPSVTIGIYAPFAAGVVLSEEDQNTVNEQFELAKNTVTNILQDGFDSDKILAAMQESAEAIIQAATTQMRSEISGLATQKRTSVNVSTGDGNDTLSVMLYNHTGVNSYTSTDLNAKTGTSFYTLGLDIDMGATDLVVDLGNGTDNMELDGRSTALSAAPDTGVAAQIVSAFLGRLVLETVRELVSELAPGSNGVYKASSIQVTGGEGDDTLNADTGVTTHCFYGANLSFNGDSAEESDQGYDRLHLSGSLAEYSSNNGIIRITDGKLDVKDRIVKVKDGEYLLNTQTSMSFLNGWLSFSGFTGIVSQLGVAYNNVDMLTDNLANKNVVSIDSQSQTIGSIQEFTEYRWNAGDIVTYAPVISGSTLFSNFYIDAGNKVTVNSLIVPGLTVYIEAPEVVIDGKVSAKNLIINSYLDNTNLLGELGSFEIMQDDATGASISVGISLKKNSETAAITFTSDADVSVTGVVVINAETYQNGGNISVDTLTGETDIPQFVIHKEGNALIDLSGKINAGGYMQAYTSTYIKFQTDELISWIPTAIGKAVSVSKITAKDLTLTTKGGVVLASRGEVYVCSFDKGNLPVVNLSFAINILDVDTKTTVSGNSSIDAGGDVIIQAVSRTNGEALSMAQAEDVLGEAKSGAFVAVNIATVSTEASVVDTSSVKGNNIRVLADSILRARSYAISSPVSSYAETSDGSAVQTQKIGALSALKFVSGIADNIGCNFFPGITGQIKTKIKSMFDDTASASGDENEDPLSIQLVGAVSFSLVKNHSDAIISTTGNIDAADMLSVIATGSTSSVQRADGSLYENSTEITIPGVGTVSKKRDAENAAAGVGLSIGIFEHDVSALLEDATVTAPGGLDLRAVSRNVGNSVITLAGHTPESDIGLGGAVSIATNKVNTSATMKKSGTYEINGDVCVEALMEKSSFETVADASGKRQRNNLMIMGIKIPLDNSKAEEQKDENGNKIEKSSVGVGAGIAVSVTGADVSAIVEDGVKFHVREESEDESTDAASERPAIDMNLDSLTVRAEGIMTDTSRAAAGAAGGTAVCPVVNTVVSGLMSEAYLGKSDELMLVKGDVLVRSLASAVRTAAADAAASGETVGIGAAIEVSVINDSSTADVYRSLDAGGNIVLAADGISRLNGTTTASTKGTKAPKETASGETGTGSTTAGTEDEINNLINGKTEATGTETAANANAKAEADEAKEAQLNNAAKLSDNVGSKNVNSTAVANSAAKAPNAQTSEGTLQVAATIAVNVQDNLVRAEVHDLCDLSAKKDVTIIARGDTDADLMANSSSANSINGVAAALALNKVDHKIYAHMGTGKLQGADVTVAAEIYEKEEADNLETAYAQLFQYLYDKGYLNDYMLTGLEENYDNNVLHKLYLYQNGNLEETMTADIMDSVIDLALENREDSEKLEQMLKDLIMYDESNDQFGEAHLTAMEKYVRAMVLAHYTKSTAPTSDYTEYLASFLASLYADIDSAVVKTEEQYNKQLLTMRYSAGDLSLSYAELETVREYLGVEELDRNEIAQELSNQFYTELTTGSTLSTLKKTGEIYADTVKTLFEDIKSKLTDVNNWKPQFVMVGLTPTLKLGIQGQISLSEIKTLGVNMIDTVITLLNNKLGGGNKLDGVGNYISTQAVSGSGSANVGVAGAVAISIVDNDCEASIASVEFQRLEGDVLATGDMRVEATNAQKTYVVATATADKTLDDGMRAEKAKYAGKSTGIGASFALNYLDSDVTAEIGNKRNVTAQYLLVSSDFQNDIDAIAVAGSDPIARRSQQKTSPAITQEQKDKQTAAANLPSTKDISVDASVAVAISESDVNAKIGENSIVCVKGKANKLEGLLNDAKGSLAVLASIGGDSYTEGSAYSAGTQTSVGATIGVSVITGNVTALLGSDKVNSGGAVCVQAAGEGYDEIMVTATSVGADVDRYLEKLRTGLSKISVGTGEEKLTDKASTFITEKFYKYAMPKATEAVTYLKNAEKQPLSGSILKILNIDYDKYTTKTMKEAKTEVKDTVGDKTNNALESTKSSNSLSVAASIGVLVTKISLTAKTLGEIITSGDVNVNAENRSNFRARATGVSAAYSSDANINSVGGSVAVTVNNNSAEAYMYSNISGAKDVNVTADTTQNLDGKYPGYLTAQAVAASVAVGKGGSLNAAGAVAIAKDSAETRAVVGPNLTINATGDMAVTAKEQSKLSVRAGGVSGGNQKAGIGAAIAVLASESNIQALVENKTKITAKTLNVEAEREMVDESLYKFPFDWSDLVTMNETEENNKGLFNINLNKDALTSTTIECNFSTKTVLSILDMINYLSMVNYYVEAIAGTISAGSDAKLAIAGTFALLIAENIVNADIGDGVQLTLTGKDEDENSLVVYAADDANTRVVAGAVTATSAKAGIGAVLAGSFLDSSVSANIGLSSSVSAPGNAAVNAKTRNNLWQLTLDDVTSTGDGAAIGGGVNVVSTATKSMAGVYGDTIAVDGDLDIGADNDLDVVLGSGSIAAATSAKAAVGGTVSVFVNNNYTSADVGYTNVTAKEITISGKTSENLIQILGSVSGATSSTAANVAGTIGVAVNKSQNIVTVGPAATLIATDGNLSVVAGDESNIILGMLSASVGGKVAVGGTVVTHYNQQITKVRVLDGSSLTAEKGNVIFNSDGYLESVIVAAAGGATTGNVGVSGVVLTDYTETTFETSIGNDVSITAFDSIAVLAQLNGFAADFGGGLGAASTAGVGGVINTLVMKNTVTASVGTNSVLRANTKLQSGGLDIEIDGKNTKRRGVIIRAYTKVPVYSGGIGAAAASTTAVTGVADTVYMQDNVIATIGDGTNVSAGVEEEGEEDDAAACIWLEAVNASDLYEAAGAFGVAGTTGVGATVVTQVWERTITAETGNESVLKAGGSVNIFAHENSNAALAALSFGAAGTTGVAAGANVQVIKSAIEASVGERATVSGNTGVEVKADSDLLLINAAAAAAAGGTSAVTPVAVVTYFKGSTVAKTDAGATLLAENGKVSVYAESVENVNTDAAGVAGAGTAAVSGTVAVTVNKKTTKASVGDGSILKGTSVNVEALDDYALLNIIGSVAGSVTASVAVLAGISIIKSTVNAIVGNNAVVDSTVGDVLVNAKGKRDVRNYSGSIAAGAEAGVSVNIMVNVIGGKMSQNARDSLAAKTENKDLEGENEYSANAFSADELVKVAGLETGFAEELNNDLAGDGEDTSSLEVSESTANIGSGYVSDDVKNTGTGEETKNQTYNDSNADTLAGIGNGSVGNSANDTVLALVASEATVIAAKNLTVTAEDLLTSDMITGNFSIGGYAGVGVGIAVTVSFSNVLAQVESGATLSAGQAVTVKAWSHSTEQTEDNQNEQSSNADSEIKDLLGDELGKTVDKYGMRVVSISASGGGFAGVGVPMAILSFDSNVSATVLGSIVQSGSVTILSKTEHENVLALTLAVTGSGFAAVSVPVTVTRARGTATSAIDGKAYVYSDNKISILGEHTLKILSVTMSIAGGTAAVNASLPIALNAMTANTYVGRNVFLEAGDLDVLCDMDTSAKTILLGFVGGGGAYGLNVAIATDKATVNTGIGNVVANTSGMGSGAVIASGTVTVKNIIQSQAVPVIIFGTAASTSQTGSVLVALSRVQSTAKVADIEQLTAKTLNVESLTPALIAKAAFYSAGVGGSVIGISVAYAQFKGNNTAEVDTTGCTLDVENMTVFAGSSDDDTGVSAQTASLSAAVGSATTGINAAVADVYQTNRAKVCGSGQLFVDGLLSVESRLVTQASAKLTGVSVSVTNIAGSVTVALNRAVNEARMDASRVSARNMSVKAVMNEAEQKSASATHVQGCGALLNASASVAVSRNKSVNRAIVTAGKLTVTEAIRVESLGSSMTETIMKNAAVSGITVSLMVGCALSDGSFLAGMAVGNGASVTAGSILVNSDYTVRTTADVAPSAGGVDAAIAKAKVNVAYADSAVTSAAVIAGKETAIIRPNYLPSTNAEVSGTVSAGSVAMTANGDVGAYSEIQSAKISVSALNIAVNYAAAKLTGTQLALGECVIFHTGDIRITSLVNDSSAEDGKQGAMVKLGATGNNKGSIEVSYASASANSGYAYNLQNISALLTNAELSADGVYVTAGGTIAANADVQTGTSVSIANTALMLVEAKAAATVNAIVTGGDRNMKARDLTVMAEYTTDADATVAPGGSSAKVTAVGADYNRATARGAVTATSAYNSKGTGTLDVGCYMTVKTEGKGNVNASYRATKLDVSLANIAMNFVRSYSEDVLSANLAAGNSVNVGWSLKVYSTYDGKGSNAVTGGSATSDKTTKVSLIGAEVNYAKAKSYTNNTINISGKSIVAGSADIQATSAGSAKAQALSADTSVNLIGVGGLYAIATVEDYTSVNINASLLKTTNGDLTISSKDTPYVYAEAQMPQLSVGLVNAAVSKVLARIGNGYTEDDPDKETTHYNYNGTYVTIANDANLQAYMGDIEITASNKPEESTAKVGGGARVSLVDINISNVQVDTQLRTEVNVGDNVQFFATATAGEGGAVRIQVIERPDSYVEANSNTLAAAVSADKFYAENYVNTIGKLTIGNNVSFKTAEGVDLKIASDIDVQAYTMLNDDLTLINKGTLTAKNTIQNDLRITIGTGLDIYNLTGDINILISGGQGGTTKRSVYVGMGQVDHSLWDGNELVENKIIAWAADQANSVFTINAVKSVTNVSTNQDITLNGGTIFSIAGSVNIENVAGHDVYNAALLAANGTGIAKLGGTANIDYNPTLTTTLNSLKIKGTNTYYKVHMNKLALTNILEIINETVTGYSTYNNKVVINTNFNLNMTDVNSYAVLGNAVLQVTGHEVSDTMMIQNALVIELPSIPLADAVAIRDNNKNMTNMNNWLDCAFKNDNATWFLGTMKLNLTNSRIESLSETRNKSLIGYLAMQEDSLAGNDGCHDVKDSEYVVTLLSIRLSGSDDASLSFGSRAEYKNYLILDDPMNSDGTEYEVTTGIAHEGNIAYTKDSSSGQFYGTDAYFSECYNYASVTSIFDKEYYSEYNEELGDNIYWDRYRLGVNWNGSTRYTEIECDSNAYVSGASGNNLYIINRSGRTLELGEFIFSNSGVINFTVINAMDEDIVVSGIITQAIDFETTTEGKDTYDYEKLNAVFTCWGETKGNVTLGGHNTSNYELNLCYNYAGGYTHSDWYAQTGCIVNDPNDNGYYRISSVCNKNQGLVDLNDWTDVRDGTKGLIYARGSFDLSGMNDVLYGETVNVHIVNNTDASVFYDGDSYLARELYFFSEELSSTLSGNLSIEMRYGGDVYFNGNITCSEFSVTWRETTGNNKFLYTQGTPGEESFSLNITNPKWEITLADGTKEISSTPELIEPSSDVYRGNLIFSSPSGDAAAMSVQTDSFYVKGAKAVTINSLIVKDSLNLDVTGTIDISDNFKLDGDVTVKASNFHATNLKMNSGRNINIECSDTATFVCSTPDGDNGYLHVNIKASTAILWFCGGLDISGSIEATNAVGLGTQNTTGTETSLFGTIIAPLYIISPKLELSTTSENYSAYIVVPKGNIEIQRIVANNDGKYDLYIRVETGSLSMPSNRGIQRGTAESMNLWLIAAGDITVGNITELSGKDIIHMYAGGSVTIGNLITATEVSVNSGILELSAGKDITTGNLDGRSSTQQTLTAGGNITVGNITELSEGGTFSAEAAGSITTGEVAFLLSGIPNGSGSFSLNASKDISVNGKLTAGQVQKVLLAAGKNLTLSGDLTGNGCQQFVLTAGKALCIGGNVSAADTETLTLTAGSTLTVNGNLSAGRSLAFSSKTGSVQVEGDMTVAASDSDTAINAGDDFIVNGVLAYTGANAGQLTLNARGHIKLGTFTVDSPVNLTAKEGNIVIGTLILQGNNSDFNFTAKNGSIVVSDVNELECDNLSLKACDDLSFAPQKTVEVGNSGEAITMKACNIQTCDFALAEDYTLALKLDGDVIDYGILFRSNSGSVEEQLVDTNGVYCVNETYANISVPALTSGLVETENSVNADGIENLLTDALWTDLTVTDETIAAETNIVSEETTEPSTLPITTVSSVYEDAAAPETIEKTACLLCLCGGLIKRKKEQTPE